MLMSAGCSSASRQAQAEAARNLGRAGAGVTVQQQPAECGLPVPHVAIREGQELRSLLKRERTQLEVANGRIRDCYTFNKAQLDGLAGR
jgi:hypothetical protein